MINDIIFAYMCLRLKKLFLGQAICKMTWQDLFLVLLVDIESNPDLNSKEFSHVLWSVAIVFWVQTDFYCWQRKTPHVSYLFQESWQVDLASIKLHVLKIRSCNLFHSACTTFVMISASLEPKSGLYWSSMIFIFTE